MLVGTQQQYEVQKILKKRINFKGQVRYFVKWLNYPSELNTWETPDNLENAQQLISQFERHENKVEKKIIRKFNSKHEVRTTYEQKRPEKKAKYIVISDDQARDIFQADRPAISQPQVLEKTQAIDQQCIDTTKFCKQTQKTLNQVQQSKICLENNDFLALRPKEIRSKPTIHILKPCDSYGKKQLKYLLNNKKYISSYETIKKYAPLELLQFYEKHFTLYQVFKPALP